MRELPVLSAHESGDLFAGPDTPYAVSICVRCRGTKFLCGKPACPILVRYFADQKVKVLTEKSEMEGLSPPGVFIGRYGYPKVDIGPFISPVAENVDIMDTPELWLGKSLDEITQMRFSLVRGKHSVRVDNRSGDRVYNIVQEIAMSSSTPEIEVKFSRPPVASIGLSDSVQPFGRSGTIERVRAATGRFNKRIEKAYNDSDLKASDAVVNLYRSNVLVSSIQRAFSAGVLGLNRNRKMVPTRWSITAVDDMLGKALLSRNKYNPVLEEFRIYTITSLDNRWVVMMLPTSWRYELVEAWYPNTTWNPMGKQISIFSSYEFFEGRKQYAEIGGCYYSARLAVNELFEREKLQAGVVILRESHPGYIMPIGVWNVREHVRKALTTQPHKFETLDSALSFAQQILDIPMKRWIANSGVLKNYIQQTTLDSFAAA